MSTLVRSKLLWVAVLILLIGSMTGVIDFPSFIPHEEQHLGPKNPGLNRQFNCRFASLEIEAGSELDDPPESYTGRLTAHFGTAGAVTNERITIPEWYHFNGAYHREFCARPGSVVSAQVVLDGPPADMLECFFMIGPDIEDDVFSAPKPVRSGPHVATACTGIVPA